MSRGESIAQAALIWLFVFPSVVALSYFMGWIAPGWPKWAVLLVTTMFTVSFIEFLVIGWVEKLIARRRGQTHAELMRDRARDAEGPDPEGS